MHQGAAGGPLAADVSAFIDAATTGLGEIARRPPSTFVAEATIEASDLVAAVVDADGRLDDAELRAYVDAVGVLSEPPVIATPAELRASGLLVGRRGWLRAPSALFTLLADADARDGSRHSHAYYARSLALAHRVAAVDLVPSPSELAAIDEFRTGLLRAMDSRGVPRPGARPLSRETPPAAGGRTPSQDGPDRPKAATTAAEAVVEARPAAGPTPARSLDDLLAELDGLIGLGHVKREVRRLTSMLHVQQLRAERGLPVIETSHHLVFSGNPGTGKTTVARLLSQIYHALGVVSRGHLVETDRSRLVAGYVGQTAIRTREVLESGLGGTVLIDEAYALARGGENDFGREAIDTLVKFMEDHRDDVAIVAAGYVEEMSTFVAANPGLASRFTRTIDFPDYTVDELVAIFASMGDAVHYIASPDALVAVRHLVTIEPRTRGFGNARFVRNLFEAAVARHAERVAPLGDPFDEQLVTLTASDVLGE